MKKYFIFLLLLLGSCSQDRFKIEEVEFRRNADLILIKKLIYPNTGKNYVGLVRDIEVIEDRIFISDRSNNAIHVFDLNLKYLKGSSGKGQGPAEFMMPQYLAKDGKYLLAYGAGENTLKYLDSNFQVIKKFSPPPEFTSDLSSQPVFTKSEILISAFSEFPAEKQKISHISTALLCKKDGTKIKAFCNFDREYDYNNSAYYYMNRYSLVATGFNRSLFIIQSASTKFHQFDLIGNYIKTLSYKPKFYKNPPDISISRLRTMSGEKVYEEFITKTTFLKNFFFDNVNNLLYMNYNNSKKEQFYSKSLTDVENYLVVINEAGKCIYDGRIDGFMAAVEDGYIYTLVTEGDLLVINKYQIKL